MTQRTDWIQVCHAAVGTPKDERVALRSAVRAEPDQVAPRIRLIGALYLETDAASHTARAEQLAWLCTHHPQIQLAGYGVVDAGVYPEAYDLVKRAWLASVAAHPHDAQVLKGAAAFLHFFDAHEAERLYTQGAELEPGRALWHGSLGHLYVRMARSSDSQLDGLHYVERALAAFERAHALETSTFGRFSTLIDIATTAADAERYPRATGAAKALLAGAGEFARTFQYGNALHHAHVVLGKIALAQDDVPLAVTHLQAASETPGSPQLKTFGPDLALARALLDRGEQGAVSSYLVSCLRFWRGHEAQVEAWLNAIAEGENPLRE